MKKKGHFYTAEFKQQAVALVKEAGKTAPVVAKELGVNINTLYAWLSQADSESSGEAALLAEIKKLNKALKQAEMERDILKKATAYFAKESL